MAMISPPDIPQQHRQLTVVMGASVRSVTPLKNGIVTVVAATYVDGNTAWYRFELPMHKRVVREASKEAENYLRHLSKSRLPDDAAYQAAIASLGCYTIEGVAIGEDSNPELDYDTSLHQGVNLPTIVLDEAKMTRDELH